MTFAQFLEGIANISNLALIVLGLRAFKPGVAPYIKLFVVLNIFFQVVEVLFLIPTLREGVQTIASNLAILFEMVVFMIAYWKIVHSKIFHIIITGSVMYELFAYGSRMVKHGIESAIPATSQVYFFIAVFIGSFFYFKETFKFRKEVDLLSDFDFWFIAATSFYSSMTAFYTLSYFYLRYMHVESWASWAFIFLQVIFLIQNILLCKAFLCLKKPTEKIRFELG